jgi:hypothetical protein
VGDKYEWKRVGVYKAAADSVAWEPGYEEKYT